MQSASSPAPPNVSLTVSSEPNTIASRVTGKASPATARKWSMPRTPQQRFITFGFLAAIILKALLFVVAYRSGAEFMQRNDLGTPKKQGERMRNLCRKP